MEQLKNEQKSVKISCFNKNFKNIVFSLALVGAVTGTIGLIVGSVGVNKTSTLKYYLEKNSKAVWGNSTIWVNNPNDPEFWSLYFSFKKRSNVDIIWDGKYPENYFRK